jgi:VanZ family protein
VGLSAGLPNRNQGYQPVGPAMVGRIIMERLVRLIPLLLYCAAIFLLSSLPKPPDAVSWIPDKIGHVVLYGGLGWLVARELKHSGMKFAPWIWIGSAAFCLVYGITDELHQYFVPGRLSEAGDLLADSVGGLLGGISYTVWVAAWPAFLSEKG